MPARESLSPRRVRLVSHWLRGSEGPCPARRSPSSTPGGSITSSRASLLSGPVSWQVKSSTGNQLRTSNAGPPGMSTGPGQNRNRSTRRRPLYGSGYFLLRRTPDRPINLDGCRRFRAFGALRYRERKTPLALVGGQLATAALSSRRRVRTSTPFLVTATVCSNWAESFPSLVKTVHPSSAVMTLREP